MTNLHSIWLTATHEAGHARCAIALNAMVHSVMLKNGDEGECTWLPGSTTAVEEAAISLAGICAEARFSGQPVSLAHFAEKGDGKLALAALDLPPDADAATLDGSTQFHMALRLAADLVEREWSRICALADELVTAYAAAGFNRRVAISLLHESPSPRAALPAKAAAATRAAASPRRKQQQLICDADGLPY